MRFRLFQIGCLILAGSLFGASNDNNVEWDGIHSDGSYRSPRHPVAGQAFTVELRVFRGDITSARVRTFDGNVAHHDMVWVRNEGASGQYDIWSATVPATSSPFLYYRFEITDGSDTDHFNRLGLTGSEPGSGDFLINLTELGRFPLGPTPDAGSVVFRVWAPNATAVHVAGDFNGWNTTAAPLTNVAGVWQTRLTNVLHGQQYKYAIENGTLHWRTDPHARRFTSSVGNSVFWQPDLFSWSDTNWVTPYFEDMILYELHVGTFSGEDDGATGHPATFRDVVDRHLDHLVESGVNMVELMPINEFAADLSWGYNPVSQYAIESVYGHPDDLKHLINRLHQAGLGVLVDVVFNHMGASDLAGNILEYDGDEIYFYPEGDGYRDTPWGPRPNYGLRPVREYLTDTVRYWIEEYHVDGFRLDGTDFIKVNTDGWRLLRDIKFATDSLSPKAIVTAEQLPNDPAVTQGTDAGGAGLDAQWNDAFHDSLRDALDASAFGDPDIGRLVAGMNHFDFGGPRAINYIESHDEVAVHGRAVEAADPSDPHSVWAYGRGKLAYGLVMFTAGIPMLLQGQELMEDRRFGDATGNRIQWDYRQDYLDYFLACRDMTWLRRRSPALRANAGQNIFHVNEAANVVAWHRWAGPDDDLIIVASFNNNSFENYCIGLPLDGTWMELINTDASVYGGDNHGNGGFVSANGGGLHGFPYSACIALPRTGLLVLGRRTVDLTPDLDADNDGMPNDWERLHNLDPNNPEDGTQDPDQDQMNNQEEYQADTDPHAASSRFLISRVEVAPGMAPRISWISSAERHYRIHASSGLGPAQWVEIGSVEGTGGEMTFADPRPEPVPPWFYRIDASP